MALKLETEGLDLGSKSGVNLLVRQDSLMFRNFNLNIIQAAGAPVGDYEEGQFFFNTKDIKLYLAANYKISHTPTLLWYKFNESLQDFSTGTHNDGTTAGNPAYVAGQYGKAITLDGTDDKVTIPNAIGLDWTQDWTISFWVKLSGDLPVGEKVYILTQYVDATHYAELYLLGTGGNLEDLTFRSNDGGGEVIDDLNVQYDSTAGGWVFFEVIHDTSLDDTDVIKRVGDSFSGQGNSDVPIGNIGATTEDYEIGYSAKDTSFGDVEAYIDDLKIWQTRRATTFSPIADESKIDSYDINKVHWASFSGSAVE